MRLILDVARGLAESIRETLPGDETEAGVWLAGFTWAFALFWLLVIATTLAYLKAHGLPT